MAKKAKKTNTATNAKGRPRTRSRFKETENVSKKIESTGTSKTRKTNKKAKDKVNKKNDNINLSIIAPIAIAQESCKVKDVDSGTNQFLKELMDNSKYKAGKQKGLKAELKLTNKNTKRANTVSKAKDSSKKTKTSIKTEKVNKNKTENNKKKAEKVKKPEKEKKLEKEKKPEKEKKSEKEKKAEKEKKPEKEKKSAKNATKRKRKTTNNDNEKSKKNKAKKPKLQAKDETEEDNEKTEKEDNDETEEEDNINLNIFNESVIEEKASPIVASPLSINDNNDLFMTNNAFENIAKAFGPFGDPQKYISTNLYNNCKNTNTNTTANNNNNNNNTNNNNNNVYLSSTSAFSVPSQPKYNSNQLLPQQTHSMIINDQPKMLPQTAPLSSVQQPPTVMNISHQSLISQQHQNSSFSYDDTTNDLSPELIQSGWRKFFSNRLKRFYYFNRFTNESSWEIPKLKCMHDPLKDLSSNSYHPTTIGDPGLPPMYPQLNQHPQTNENNNAKKSYFGSYDLDIISNCQIWEGPCYCYFHPHPDIEQSRSDFVKKLRKQYMELCRTRQNIEAPKDSFTKWIIERKLVDKGRDPFLPSECSMDSSLLYNEIIKDIPIKLIKVNYCGEARKQLSNYAEAAKKIIDAPNVSSHNRKIVKWSVTEAFNWIRNNTNAPFEDYINYLEHLKKQCQPLIIEAAKSSVESICTKIFQLSIDYARRIKELNLEIFRLEDLRERGPIRLNVNKAVPCYPAYMTYPCPKLPFVQMYPEKDLIILRYKNYDIIKLEPTCLQKLEMLYNLNCRDDRKFVHFLARVWCLITRYQSFFDPTEGFSFQNSLPLSVFAALNKHFGVTFECFASPLNCFFRQYCSLFPDIDGYFGSRGLLTNFFPISGSFQANPPQCNELIEASITHFEKLLQTSMEPLSFIIFIQANPEISPNIFLRLESNKFKRMHLCVPALEHEYRTGLLNCIKNEVTIKSKVNTLIYFLQNDAGFLKWGPTQERVEELVESFKLGRDKQIDIKTVIPRSNNLPSTSGNTSTMSAKPIIQNESTNLQPNGSFV